jgi:predicted transcriptional regulator
VTAARKTPIRKNTEFVGLWIPPEIKKGLLELAERNHRALSGEMRLALERYLEAAAAKDGVAV